MLEHDVTQREEQWLHWNAEMPRVVQRPKWQLGLSSVLLGIERGREVLVGRGEDVKGWL